MERTDDFRLSIYLAQSIALSDTFGKLVGLKAGTIIDRYGSKWGTYTSPPGTPFEQRALPYDNNAWAYHRYEVIKDISDVTSSEIAPAFNQPGGGIQYELPKSIKELIKDGFLKEIFFYD